MPAGSTARDTGRFGGGFQPGGQNGFVPFGRQGFGGSRNGPGVLPNQLPGLDDQNGQVPRTVLGGTQPLRSRSA
jgi:hypothetical protein